MAKCRVRAIKWRCKLWKKCLGLERQNSWEYRISKKLGVTWPGECPCLLMMCRSTNRLAWMHIYADLLMTLTRNQSYYSIKNNLVVLLEALISRCSRGWREQWSRLGKWKELETGRRLFIFFISLEFQERKIETTLPLVSGLIFWQLYQTQGFQLFRIYFKKLSSYRNLWSIWLIHDETRNPWPIHDHADDADQKLQKRTRQAGASNRSLHVLEIHDHSTRMLTMLTQNGKIAPEMWVRRTELTRAAAENFE